MLTKLSSRFGLPRDGVAGAGLISLVIKLSSVGITFALLALLSRLLSSKDYGSFAFLFSLFSFLGIFATMGFHRSILRSISELEVRGEANRISRCLALGTEFVIGSSLVVTAALLLGAFGLGELSTTLVIAATLIFSLAYSEFVAAALRALGFLGWALVPKDIAWRGGGALFFGILLASGHRISLWEVFGFLSAWLALLIMVQTLVMLRAARTDEAKLVPASHALRRRSLLKLSLPMWAASVLFNAAQHIDVVVVGIFLPATTVGLYFNVARTANLLLFVVFALELVASPQMAKAYNSKDAAELQGTLRVCSALSLAPTLAGFILVATFSEHILSIFGPEFLAGVPLLVAMSATFLIAAACGPIESFMQMSGLEQQYLKIIGATYAMGLVAMACLLPLIGVWGAVVGHFISIAVRNMVAAIYARRKIGIDPSVFSLLRRTLPPGAKA